MRVLVRCKVTAQPRLCRLAAFLGYATALGGVGAGEGGGGRGVEQEMVGVRDGRLASGGDGIGNSTHLVQSR
jgi:hypothetical protein